MAVSAAAAANVILSECERRGIAADPMKLQKLMYLTHGYYSGLTGEPWINEPFEAWDYGPVLPSVYRSFRDYGALPIKSGARMATPEVAYIGGNLEKVLNFVMDRYASRTSIYLSELTHKPGSPWEKVKSSPEGKMFKNVDIPFQYVKDYFTGLAKKKAE